MLIGNLRPLAEAIISGNYRKASSAHRDLAEAIISRNHRKAPSGPLRNFAEAIISGNYSALPPQTGPVLELVL